MLTFQILKIFFKNIFILPYLNIYDSECVLTYHALSSLETRMQHVYTLLYITIIYIQPVDV
jgi:hypothetical protein